MARPRSRLWTFSTLAVAVMAALIITKPSRAELALRDFQKAEKLADWCGEQAVMSVACGLRSPFSQVVRHTFLAHARKRGASEDQLKSLNWTWQLAVARALEFLSVARLDCTRRKSKVEEFRKVAEQCKRSR
jgi:hypothetical protein